MNENSIQPEVVWLQHLREGNEEALASLMRTYYDALNSYASRFTKDDALIKDCIQEVFISLWQRRNTANKILSCKYYLLRAIKNKVLKALHKSFRTTSLVQDEYEFYYEFSIESLIIEKQISEENACRLRNTLSCLSNRQKEIIYLKYYQYIDHAQIAELMNISRQSVYNLLHETIDKLRELWHAELVTH